MNPINPLTKLSLETLKKRQSLLMLERKKLILRLKGIKSPFRKKLLVKKLQETNYRLGKVNTEINRRKSLVVKQGTKLVPFTPSIKQPQVSMFKPSASSSFAPSVVPKPSIALPLFIAPAIAPQPSFVASQQPSFVQPVVPAPLDMQKMDLPAIADEIIEEQDIIDNADLDTQTDGFDYMAFLDDNKLMIGAGLLVGLYFVFGRSKPKRSNPRRTKRKTRKSRKVRRNSAGARRGYKRH